MSRNNEGDKHLVYATGTSRGRIRAVVSRCYRWHYKNDVHIPASLPLASDRSSTRNLRKNFILINQKVRLVIFTYNQMQFVISCVLVTIMALSRITCVSRRKSKRNFTQQKEEPNAKSNHGPAWINRYHRKITVSAYIRKKFTQSCEVVVTRFVFIFDGILPM